MTEDDKLAVLLGLVGVLFIIGMMIASGWAVAVWFGAQ